MWTMFVLRTDSRLLLRSILPTPRWFNSGKPYFSIRFRLLGVPLSFSTFRLQRGN